MLVPRKEWLQIELGEIGGAAAALDDGEHR
jgi:hypothetical protein